MSLWANVDVQNLVDEDICGEDFSDFRGKSLTCMRTYPPES